MRNLLLVMNKGDHSPSVRYNAVVTKGISLMSYMLQMMMMTYTVGGPGKTPFLVFSTSHNSYITSGNTTISTDEQGRLIFCKFFTSKEILHNPPAELALLNHFFVLASAGNHNVTIESDGSVTLKSKILIFSNLIVFKVIFGPTGLKPGSLLRVKILPC